MTGQAKDLLMARHGLDADEAFRTLVRRSRNSNTKLVVVAQNVVADRADPSIPAAPSGAPHTPDGTG